MQDPKKPLDPEPSTSAEAEPQPGGFGAFADIYRARWAAAHPNMRPRASSRPALDTEQTNTTEPDPSRVHTEDGTRVFHLKDRS